MDKITQRIGIVIKTMRTQAGIKQGQLAEMAEISQPYVSRIERGSTNSGIHLDALCRISKALGIGKLSDLFLLVEEVEEPGFLGDTKQFAAELIEQA